MRIFGEVELDAAPCGPLAAQELARVRENLAAVRSIVAVTSARGGVGKSTIAVNVAAALAAAGRKLAIVDADLNSPSIVAMLGMKPVPRLQRDQFMEPVAGPLGLRVAASNLMADGEPPPVSFFEEEPPQAAANGVGPVELSYTGTLRRILGQTRFGALDLMLIDLAPGLEQLYRLSKMVKPSGAILVTQPSELSARAAMNAINLVAHMSVSMIGIIENMVGFSCDGCRSVRPLMPQGDLASLVRDAGTSVLARLPFDPRLAESCDRGTLFIRDYPEAPLATQLVGLAQTIDRGLARRLSPPPARA